MRWILCLLMLVSLGFAPAPVYRPRNDVSMNDLEKLQGTWHSPSRVSGQSTEPATTWKFTKDMLELRDADGAVEYRILIDPGRRPKTFWVKMFGKVPFGILYKFDGDTLTVCYHESLSTTPREFGGEQPGEVQIVFERRKDR